MHTINPQVLLSWCVPLICFILRENTEKQTEANWNALSNWDISSSNCASHGVQKVFHSTCGKRCLVSWATTLNREVTNNDTNDMKQHETQVCLIFPVWTTTKLCVFDGISLWYNMEVWHHWLANGFHTHCCGPWGTPGATRCWARGQVPVGRGRIASRRETSVFFPQPSHLSRHPLQPTKHSRFTCSKAKLGNNSQITYQLVALRYPL